MAATDWTHEEGEAFLGEVGLSNFAIRAFLAPGGGPPVRGYGQDDLIDGVVITGAPSLSV